MFEAFEASSHDVGARKRAAASTLVAAFAYGLLALGVVILARRAAVEQIEKLVEVTFERPLPKVAPPPPPPPPKPKKVAVKQPVAPSVAPPPPAAPPPPKEMPKEAAPEADPSKAVAVAPMAEVGGSGSRGVHGGTGTAPVAEPAVVANPDTPVELPEDAEPAELLPGFDLRPEYPEVARAAGKEGVVIIKIVIRRDGTVGDIKVLRGESPFVEVALEKVKAAKYRPAMHNGHPIAVSKIIKIPFRLSVGG